MKPMLLIIMLFAYCTVFGQNDTSSIKTALESFSNKSGTVLEKKSYKIGEMSKIIFSVMQVKDLSTDLTVVGVVLNITSISGIVSPVATNIAYLDSDEVDGLIKAISYIKENIDTMPVEYTEIRYTSRGDFMFGIFNENNKWVPYFSAFDYIGARVYLKVNEIDYFLYRIIECQEKINMLQSQ